MHTTFRGLKINIENEAGSVRKGIGENGKPWKVTMVYDYGEILGSMGVDGDPVDCFIGPNTSAKFVYGIHQTKKDGTGFDEQKFMLGFNDAMDAKQAYFKSYDEPEHFFTNVEAIPLEVFKKKVMETKSNPIPIHASQMNTTIALHAESSSAGPGIGMPVVVDGMHGRGVVVKITGRRVTVRFRSGLYVTRDAGSVHALSDNYYKSRYSSVR